MRNRATGGYPNGVAVRRSRAAIGTVLTALLTTLASAADQPADGSAAQRAGAWKLPAAVTAQVRLANGEVFTVVKRWENGRPVREFRRGDLVLTPEQMRRYELEHAPPVLEEDLRRRIEQLDPRTRIPVKVWLRHRPGLRIAHELRLRQMQQLAPLQREIREIHQLARPAEPLDPQQEREFVESLGGYLSAAYAPWQLQRLAELKEQVAAIREQAKRELIQRAEQAVARDREEMTATIEALGGRVLGYVATMNLFEIEIPAGRVAELAADPRVASVFDVPPVEPALDVQAEGLGLTSGFWADGITGASGAYEAAILDSGIQQDHPALSHLNITSSIGATDPIGHGTAVAGIIAANAPPYRGMAYGATKLFVGSYSSAVVMSEADWLWNLQPQGPEVVNLSASYGNVNGYSPFEQFWDAYVGLGLSVSVAAGNGGPAAASLTRPANAYNVISVGNVDDQNTVTRFDDVIHVSSSRGPADGRKKPDLVAPGHNTMTTNADWITGPDFANFGGTSAATPHVTGGVLLLFDSGTWWAKGVLIQTADAWSDNGTPSDTSDDAPALGSHWDPSYGWGQLDLWEAWFNSQDNIGEWIWFFEGYKLFKVYLFANEKATLSWNRRVSYEGPVFPSVVYDLTDLDLLAYDADTGDLITGSVSALDNVEQISVPSDGFVILKVRMFSIDPAATGEAANVASEEGLIQVDPPVIIAGGHGGTASPGRQFRLFGGMGNSGGTTAFNNEIELVSLPPGFTLVSGDNPRSVPPVCAGGGCGAGATWVVQAPCAIVSDTATITARSYSYGELLTDTGTAPIDVLPPDTLTGDVWVDDNAIEKTWSFPVLSNEWSAVGLSPDIDNVGRNRDIWGDEQLCITSPYAQSEEPGDTRDFIAANGHVLGAATHYAMVTGEVGGSYTVELDHAHDLLVDASPVSDSMSAFEVIQTYEVFLTAGNHYRFRIDMTAGALDVALFGFQPGRAAGERGTADYVADENGPGGGESIHLTAPMSGYYYFVATNENHNGANYTVQVETMPCGPGCDTDVNNDCVVDLADLSQLLNEFGGPGVADFNNDGVVDLTDLSLLLGQFGSDCN